MSNQSVQASARSLWILSPSRDLLLFVATPVLIIPVVLIALQRVEGPQIEALVVAFGALGHNLPGMIRAYGDRALFRRFRTRFILAPIVLGSVTFAFYLQQRSESILVIVYFWGAWHALMQVYGFLRIYDAKVGAVTPRIARLDLAMVIAWFSGVMVLSDARVYHLQELLINFGVSPITTDSLGVLRLAFAGLLGGVTAAYVVNEVVQWRAGTRVNPVKHLLMLTAIGFWWYAHFMTSNVLLGLIMFEIFHDVQYLAIVWVFNRRRVETDANVGGFTSFLFRNSFGMMGIYLALVFAYGGIGRIQNQFQFGETGAAVIYAFIVTSGFLHYYLDGFIWKVRERSTRKALGVDDGSGSQDKRVRRHALKWLLFLVPCAVMWILGENPPAAVEEAEALIKSTPRAAQAHTQLGKEFTNAGRYLDSVPVLTRSLEIMPDDRGAQRNLSLAQLFAARNLWRKNEREQAERLLEQAYARNPKTVIGDCNNQALRLLKLGQFEAAILNLQVALLMKPDSATVHFNLAVVYHEAGQLSLSLQHAKQAAALRPHYSDAEQLVRSLQGR